MQQIKAIGYPFHRTPYGVFNPISDIVENVKGKILNLLYTRKGQRIISQNCQFGIDLQKMLFENLGYSDYAIKVSAEIERVIKFWIKEIDTVNVLINIVEHKLELNITFTVGQQSDNIFLEFNLNEIT